MKALSLSSLTVALLLSALPALAGNDEDLSSKPGYVDFGELAAAYGEPRVMVNIGGSLLQLVGAMEHHDPVAEAALKNLDSVRIHVYDTAGDIAAAASRMEDASEVLGKLDWEPVVQVRESDERVNIYVKHGEEQIHGVTVMVVDEEEAVFINVLGDINPAELSMVMDHVDLDVDMDLDL